MNLVGDYPISFFVSIEVQKLSSKLFDGKESDKMVDLIERCSLSSNKILSDIIYEDFAFISENEKVEIDATCLETMLDTLSSLHTMDSEADMEEGEELNREELEEAIASLNDLLENFNFNVFNLSISFRR